MKVPNNCENIRTFLQTSLANGVRRMTKVNYEVCNGYGNVDVDRKKKLKYKIFIVDAFL